MSGRGRATLAPAAAAAVLAAAAALLAPGRTPAAEARDAAAHYRAHQDLASLHGALPELRLGRARAEVESLLGPPTYCPVPDEQCYYATGSRNSAGVTLALVVEYRTLRGDAESVRTDRLESLYLGPVAE